MISQERGGRISGGRGVMEGNLVYKYASTEMA